MVGHGSIQTQGTSSLWTGDKSKDRVVINVGGTRHECYISTIQNFPDTRLYWIAETALKMADFDPDGNEFFFDRHPGCFQNILNYCRTGKLHCPNDVCGPLFEAELAFWGVDELMMEPCCWGSYTQHRDANKNLKMFDQMRDSELDDTDNDDTDYDCFEDGDNCKRIKKKEEKSKFWQTVSAIRVKVWNTLERPFSSRLAQICALVSMLVILLSTTTFCLETMHHFKNHYTFEILEKCYCVFFTVEFLLRVFCCPSLPKLVKSVMTWVDFISTFQFYISFFISRSYQFLFVSRMIRIFRLFRFFKRLSGMQVIGQTLKASANELFLLCLIVFIPMVIFSTLMYYAEYENNGNQFANIPETFWWAIITMTTVGYGDKYPKSNYGKMIGTLCACSGVLIVALPVSVIGSNFSLYYSYAQARMRLPKRKSPALVSADKALVHRNNEKGGSQQSLPTEKSHSIVSTLGGLASVMVDLAIPSKINEGSNSDDEKPPENHGRFGKQSSLRERRHAIQPSVNPISRQGSKNSKEKSRKESSAPSIAGALSSIGAGFSLGIEQSLRSFPQNENNNEDAPTHDEGYDSKTLLPTIQQSEESPKHQNTTKKKGSFANLFKRKDKNCKTNLDIDCDDMEPNLHSRSSDLSESYACEYVRSPRGRYQRRILHMDIEQYQPRKLSTSEHKARRKLSAVNKRTAQEMPRRRSQSETENLSDWSHVNGLQNDQPRYYNSVPTTSFLRHNNSSNSMAHASFQDTTYEESDNDVFDEDNKEGITLNIDQTIEQRKPLVTHF